MGNGVADLRDCVAGEGYERGGPASGTEERADLGGIELCRMRGEVDAVKSRGECDVGAGGDQDLGMGACTAHGWQNLEREVREGSGGQVFLADEEQVDAITGDSDAAVDQPLVRLRR